MDKLKEKLKNLSKKQICIIAGAIFLALIAIILVFAINSNNSSTSSNIQIEQEVTAEEKESYRDMIGNGMDIRKAILVMFESEEECKEFIAKHGADKHPEDCGLGKVPLMEDGYYNIGGKQELEDAFDILSDGEYSGEPVMYSGMYCYLKRLELYSPLKNDKDLESLIRSERKMSREGR